VAEHEPPQRLRVAVRVAILRQLRLRKQRTGSLSKSRSSVARSQRWSVASPSAAALPRITSTSTSCVRASMRRATCAPSLGRSTPPSASARTVNASRGAPSNRAIAAVFTKVPTRRSKVAAS
jgi:hypothetical protein